MNVYVEITIPVSSETESDILVALLSRIGFEGFEEDDHALRAFIPETLYDEKRLLDTVIDIRKTDPSAAPPFSVKRIQPENWNAIWEQHFQPVTVNDFCSVRASFHDAAPGVKYDLVITPKMSFGTGHHATTYMMLEAMSLIDFYAEEVLDFGTGTGILAILAEKMGSVSVRAIDMDPWSIENARENLAANGTSHISLAQKSDLDGEGVFDIILANINLHVILQNLGFLWQHLDENGVIIGSGVLAADEEQIRKRAEAEGFLVYILNQLNDRGFIGFFSYF
jgi:ribosomal protein L11 methyltransferase